jgi:hypothetical protein
LWGYSREISRELTNEKTGETYRRIRATESCRKFFELTGKHGPAILSTCLACKYYEEKPKAQAPQQSPAVHNSGVRVPNNPNRRRAF